MTDQTPRLNIGLFVLAGMGAGALTGVLAGVLSLRRSSAQRHEEISETVDDLKHRAEMILTELSRSHAPDSGD